MVARPTAGTGWWFDEAVPGTTLIHPLARTIGADEHVWLAWLTNNASDVHGNADRAAAGAWGSPLVLGALSVAIVIGLAQPAEARTERQRPGAGWQWITLERPVLPGDTLRAVSEIHERSAAGRDDGFVQRTIRGLSQRDQVVLTVRETLLVPTRPAKPGARSASGRAAPDKGFS